MTRVYIDISVLYMASFITGIQRVTREVIAGFLRENRCELVLMNYHVAEHTYYRIDSAAFVDYFVHHKGIKEKMLTKERIPLEQIGEGTIFFDLDAVWMSPVKRSYLLPILKEQGAQIVVHIYDIISITHPQYCMDRGVYHFMDYIGAHLLYADKIITNARATVRELEKLAERCGTTLPSCHVVPLGADFTLKKEDESGVSPEMAQQVGSAPYLLMVGTIEPRKNHKLLLDAYDMGLKEMGYHVIFAGYIGWDMEEFTERLQNHPDYQKGIFHYDHAGDAEITYLYSHARFVSFCSYTEGYGLPLVESIQRGTPVLASDIPVSREVAGDYCDYFEQDEPEKLIELVRYYEEHEEAYRQRKKMLGKAEFQTWEKSVQGMLKAII